MIGTFREFLGLDAFLRRATGDGRQSRQTRKELLQFGVVVVRLVVRRARTLAALHVDGRRALRDRYVEVLVSQYPSILWQYASILGKLNFGGLVFCCVKTDFCK